MMYLPAEEKADNLCRFYYCDEIAEVNGYCRGCYDMLTAYEEDRDEEGGNTQII